jgi:hypothetical protein
MTGMTSPAYPARGATATAEEKATSQPTITPNNGVGLPALGFGVFPDPAHDALGSRDFELTIPD